LFFIVIFTASFSSSDAVIASVSLASVVISNASADAE
jgi:hypothetical protein